MPPLPDPTRWCSGDNTRRMTPPDVMIQAREQAIEDFVAIKKEKERFAWRTQSQPAMRRWGRILRSQAKACDHRDTTLRWTRMAPRIIGPRVMKGWAAGLLLILLFNLASFAQTSATFAIGDGGGMSFQTNGGGDGRRGCGLRESQSGSWCAAPIRFWQ